MQIQTVRIVLLLFSFSILFTMNTWGQNSKYDNAVEAPYRGIPTDEWAVRVAPNTNIQRLSSSLTASEKGRIEILKDIYILKFDLGNNSIREIEQNLGETSEVLWFERQYAKQRAHRLPNDRYLNEQWHLQNTGQSGATVGEDINVGVVWDCYGITGSDVQIAIVDDGLQYTHPDLSPNYVAADSYDFNDGDADPAPLNTNRHGTACAGVAAAKGNNNRGVAGAAYDANLSGIRLIAGIVTDATEANALSFRNKATTPGENWIYSNSWGPDDAAQWYEDAGPLVESALQTLAQQGMMYVWAGGNGLTGNDNVNYDGYTNSIYTIAVGAHNSTGVQSNYSEPGACLLISMPSNGGLGITTTDLLGTAGYNSGPSGDNDYTAVFGGTSSACPLAAGMVALILEANPTLSWRDMQYLLANSAEVIDATDADWTTNGAVPAHNINHKYGFGRVNAKDAIKWAWRWTNVPAKTTFSSGTLAVNQPIPDGIATGVGNYGSTISDTYNVTQDIILEHVEVKFKSSDHTFRGDIRVRLTSPDGTESILSESHAGDATDGLDWTFMSVRHWGESSLGNWTVTVDDGYLQDTGTFEEWELILHGVPTTDYCGDMSIPNIITASNVSSTTATMNWTAIGATSYELQYREFGTTAWLNTSTSTNTLALTGLTACQDYEVRIRSVCSNGNKTHYSESFYFSTEDILLGNTTFENNMGLSGWTVSSSNLFCTYETCGGYCANTGEHFIQFGQNTGIEYIERNLTFPVCSSAELTFLFSAPHCFRSSSSNITLYIDGTSVWTQNWTYNACNSNTYASFSINLSAYADGSTHTIRFESDANSSVFLIDDIKICANDCAGVMLSPKVFLQGPLSGTSMNTDLKSANLIPTISPYTDAKTVVGTMPANAVDWVWVEIRSDNTATPAVVLGQSGILLSNGTVVDASGGALSYNVAVGQAWHVVIKHRNHLSIMSASTVVLN